MTAGGALSDQLQQALGPGFRVERELGGGGMSRVFLTRDLSLDRPVVVKVLPPDLAGVSVERFKREIAVAARLQHPHIVPLLAAGEMQGLPYYTMPFVVGESLRHHLASHGPLAIGESVRLLRDIASALAHAHREGVVHRDIKPDNVMLAGGSATVLDFGVAKAVRDAAGSGAAPHSGLTSLGIALGTPAYMAPEQAAADPHVDHRADLYAFGVLAYELLTGRTPFGHRPAQELLVAHLTEAPTPVQAVRDDVPDALADLVMACLAKKPVDRPHSADAIVGVLDGLGTPTTMRGATRTRRRRAGGRVLLGLAMLGAVAAAGLAGRALGIGPWASLVAAGKLQERSRLVVADFRTTGGDSVLGGVVTEALRIDLGQSKAVALVPAQEVSEALARMQRPAGTKLDLALARELAQREGAAVVLDGEVAPIGSGAVLTARLVSADDGTELAAFRQSAKDADAVIPAIDRLSRDIRSRIGESLRAARDRPPLDEVSTTSLAALRKYAEGTRAIEVQGDVRRGRALLEEAIALDSGFAMAYRKLGVALGNRGLDPERARTMLRRAYELRDRLPPVERGLTEASYWMSVAGERDRATDALAQVLAIDPDNRTALINASALALEGREYARAESLLVRAAARDSSRGQPYLNLAIAQFAQGRVADARRTVEVLRRRFPEMTDAEVMAAALEAAVGRYDGATSGFAALTARRDADPALRAQGEAGLGALALLEGRLRAAQPHFVAGSRLAAGEGTPALQEAVLVAWLDAHFRRQPDAARRRLDEALRRVRLDTLPPARRPYFDLATTYAVAGDTVRARRLLAIGDSAWRDAVPADLLAAASALAHGEVLLAEGRPREAIRAFQRADSVAGCRVCVLPRLGAAYDLAGQRDSAIAVFERYRTTPDLFRVQADANYLAGVQKRLGELYEAKGDKDRALAAYEQFVTLWRAADPELQPAVQQVRQRIAALRPQVRA